MILHEFGRKEVQQGDSPELGTVGRGVRGGGGGEKREKILLEKSEEKVTKNGVEPGWNIRV